MEIPAQELPPLALAKYGVTVIIAVTGEEPPLEVVKEEIFPEPFAANPIDVLLLVQLYEMFPPETPVVVKETADVEEPLQTI